MRYMDLHNTDIRFPANTPETALRKLFVENYFVSSFVPTLIIIGICLYAVFKRTFGLASRVKMGFAILFMAEIGMTFVYQYYEQNYERKNWPYWIIIGLPRTMYAICLAGTVFLGLCLKNSSLLYKNRPESKDKRIASFFTLTTLNVLPILMMINGPYEQIIHLFCFAVALIPYYCFKDTKLHNSLFQYIFYGVAAFKLFYASAHRLDFLSPKIARTFVGFPEFNLIITFSIAIIDFVSTSILLLLLLPLVSVNLDDRQEETIGKFQPVSEPTSSENEGSITPGNSLAAAADQKGAEKSVLEVVRNYFVMLLYLDVVQDSYSRFLVGEFEQRFFQASHTEFTFRFINWAIYGFTIGNIFILGKI